MVLRNQTSAGLRADEAVLAVLPRTARVRAGTGSAAADLTVNGQPLEFKWIVDGRLGDVRKLLANRRHRPDVAVARRLSPGARAALSEAGIGWVDASGAAEIAVGTIVISRSGAIDNRDKRPTGWTRSVLAVAEAAFGGITATAAAMREATGLSMGSCVNALGRRSSGGPTPDRGREVGAAAVPDSFHESTRRGDRWPACRPVAARVRRSAACRCPR